MKLSTAITNSSLTSHLPMTNEHVEQVFNRLMLQGKVRSAVRSLTERSDGGILDLSSDAQGKNGATGKSVFDVLKEKYDPNVFFLGTEDLPPRELIDVFNKMKDFLESTLIFEKRRLLPQDNSLNRH